jgi:hypothetical protein
MDVLALARLLAGRSGTRRVWDVAFRVHPAQGTPVGNARRKTVRWDVNKRVFDPELRGQIIEIWVTLVRPSP